MAHKNQTNKQQKGKKSSSKSTDVAITRWNPKVPPFELCNPTNNAVASGGKTGRRRRAPKQTFSEAFDSVAKILAGRKNILVLAGAGISVSCGIPDFRTKDKGLYSTLDYQELGLTCPEDLFDWEVFREDPEPFYKFAKSLYFPLGPDRPVEPSDSHKFLAMLEQRNQLLRVYTQNIDGLEEIAGVSPKRMVYAHGSLRWATCCKCKHRVPSSSPEIEAAILNGTVAYCQAPKKSKGSNKTGNGCQPRENKRQKTGDGMGTTRKCNGVMKPGVTFFGETLPDKVGRSLEADREKADALIVIGTSLSVAPMSKVIDFLPKNIPRILINRTIVSAPVDTMDDDDDDEDDIEFRENYTFDAYMLGFCDQVTRSLVKQMKHHNGRGPSDTLATEIACGKLLAALTKKEKVYPIEDWQHLTIPRERIFLFAGAVPPDNSGEWIYNEVAHCDGCSVKISSGLIHKCVQCFDYDLCAKCFPTLSKQHFDGKHKFAKETIAG